MRAPTRHQPPVVEGFYFWSVFSSDHASKRAILDDEGGRAYAIAETAKRFEIPVDDVRAELFPHPYHSRPVWHAYVRDVHKAKVIYVNEEIEVMLRVLSAAERELWGFLDPDAL